MNLEEIYKAVKENSYSDCERIVLGNIIELKINDEGIIDVYKYADLDNVDEDYDFDGDYLTTIYC